MASTSLLSRPPLSSSLLLHHRNASAITTRLRPFNSPRFLTIKTFSAPSPVQPLTQDDHKKLDADKAVEYVSSGMVLGLGTGSTATFVVFKIGELLTSGQLKDIVGVPTSKRIQDQAASLGIPLSVFDDHPKLDLAATEQVAPMANGGERR